jgi:hypothetical protein
MDFDLDGRAARARLADFHEDGRRWRLARIAEAGAAGRRVGSGGEAGEPARRGMWAPLRAPAGALGAVMTFLLGAVAR